MEDKVTRICMGIYRKLEKSGVLNVTERLQIANNLKICYLYYLQWSYVKKIYQSRHRLFSLYHLSLIFGKCRSITYLHSEICIHIIPVTVPYSICWNINVDSVASVASWTPYRYLFTRNGCMQCLWNTKCLGFRSIFYSKYI
jgi:hypothetical protein